MPRARHQHSLFLSVEVEVRWPRGIGSQAPERAGGREQSAEEDVCRYGARTQCHERSAGKALRPSDRRWAAEYLTRVWSLSISRACGLVDLARSAWYRGDAAEKQAQVDAPVIDALNDIIEDHGRWGFWKCFDTLRNRGHRWHHKRVRRVYRAMGLNQKRRTKKRLPDREPQPLEVPGEMNHTGSFDFMSDALHCGRRFRCLNIIDEGTREALGVIPDTSLPAARVVRELEQIGSVRGCRSESASTTAPRCSRRCSPTGARTTASSLLSAPPYKVRKEGWR